METSTRLLKALGALLVLVVVSCSSAGTTRDAASLQALANLRASTPGATGCAPAGSSTRYRPEIEPYVAYLKAAPAQPPVDYVLGLFRTHDIVVLCERDHRDISQYELYYELVSDERFLSQVGHVFTEIGSRTMNPQVDALLHAEGLTEEDVASRLVGIYRDFSWQGYWEKYNLYDFMKRLYGLNVGLDASRKLSLHFSDLPVTWDGMTKARYEAEVRSLEGDRDRMMADLILKTIEDLDGRPGERHKYLVIMNYRHAFKAFPGGGNVGDYIYGRYPDRIANVMLSSLVMLPESTDKGDTRAPVQDGKWDAAFEVVDNPSVGFDFTSTPFGADHFDYYQFIKHDRRYQDVFTGYVFYRPLSEHLLMVGIPGFLDREFAPVFRQRYEMISGRTLPLGIARAAISREFNELRASAYPDLERYCTAIRRWLE